MGHFAALAALAPRAALVHVWPGIHRGHGYASCRVARVATVAAQLRLHSDEQLHLLVKPVSGTAKISKPQKVETQRAASMRKLLKCPMPINGNSCQLMKQGPISEWKRLDFIGFVKTSLISKKIFGRPVL